MKPKVQWYFYIFFTPSRQQCMSPLPTRLKGPFSSTRTSTKASPVTGHCQSDGLQGWSEKHGVSIHEMFKTRFLLQGVRGSVIPANQIHKQVETRRETRREPLFSKVSFANVDHPDLDSSNRTNDVFYQLSFAGTQSFPKIVSSWPFGQQCCWSNLEVVAWQPKVTPTLEKWVPMAIHSCHALTMPSINQMQSDCSYSWQGQDMEHPNLQKPSVRLQKSHPTKKTWMAVSSRS